MALASAPAGVGAEEPHDVAREPALHEPQLQFPQDLVRTKKQHEKNQWQGLNAGRKLQAEHLRSRHTDHHGDGGGGGHAIHERDHGGVGSIHDVQHDGGVAAQVQPGSVAHALDDGHHEAHQ